MSMDLSKQTFSTTPNYLIAGNAEINTATKVAASALATGAPVKLDSNGKAAKITSTSDTPYGIVADSVGEANSEVVIYLTGEFFADALVFETGVTAADLEVGFRNIGIFLK